MVYCVSYVKDERLSARLQRMLMSKRTFEHQMHAYTIERHCDYSRESKLLRVRYESRLVESVQYISSLRTQVSISLPKPRIM